MVLLKDFDESGFVFYTNLESRKGSDLAENPYAALLFHWKSLRRQVRVEGPVSPVGDDEADDYFASRPRGSRIGAWASDQSRPMEGMFVLEKRVAEFTAKFGVGEDKAPAALVGFRIAPERIEFWQRRAVPAARAGGLHPRGRKLADRTAVPMTARRPRIRFIRRPRQTAG